jgi:hypothetical protein
MCVFLWSAAAIWPQPIFLSVHTFFHFILSSHLSHINSLFLHVYTLQFTVICCVMDNGKGKVHPEQATKAQRGVEV